MSRKLTKIEKSLRRLGRITAKIAKDRDELREAHEEAGGLLEDADMADNSLSSAMSDIDEAIDLMSQMV